MKVLFFGALFFQTLNQNLLLVLLLVAVGYLLFHPLLATDTCIRGMAL